MSACTLPSFNFSLSLPPLPPFPSFTLPTFSLAINLSCPID